MKLERKRIGFVMTGSFCTFKKTIEELKNIVKEKAEIVPIMSYNAYNLDTKFGKAKDFIDEIQKISRKRNNSYNTSSRSNWAKTDDRYNDSSTCNRKYNGKTCK